jgi:hypothetical protein
MEASQSSVRQCSRVGCKSPAVAEMEFEYLSRRVWITELQPDPEPSCHHLCAVHLGRFAPPKLWETHDLRMVSAQESIEADQLSVISRHAAERDEKDMALTSRPQRAS